MVTFVVPFAPVLHVKAFVFWVSASMAVAPRVTAVTFWSSVVEVTVGVATILLPAAS